LNNSIKAKLYTYCCTYINEKQQTLALVMATAKESANDESKSSAGDKHETGRAMAQLEQEKLSVQFQEIEKAKQILAKINPDLEHNQIGVGALVKTNSGNYYIAISAGKTIISGETYYLISSASPIAKAFIAKAQQQKIVFNNQTIEILSVM